VLFAETNGARTGAVTLAIRPERAALVAPETDGALPAAVEDVVYAGTDTSVHISIGGQVPFWVRIQNRDGGAPKLAPGERVGLAIPPAAVQVLTD
jgi:ABC-type Fe3+/spermidine/putrescine transport system ATPase subunit